MHFSTAIKLSYYFLTFCFHWQFYFVEWDISRLKLWIFPSPGRGTVEYTDVSVSPTASIIYPDYGTSVVFRNILIISLLVTSQQKPVFKLNSIHFTATITNVGRDSSVGIATRYGLNGPGIEFRSGRDIWHPSRTALGPTHRPVNWAPALFLECKAAGV